LAAKSDFEYSWLGICSNREQLVSGRVTVSGSRWKADNQANDKIVPLARYNIRIVFDYAAGTFLYQVDGKPPEAGVYLKTKEFQLMANCQKGSVAGIFPLSTKPYAYFILPDPRALGCISEIDMRHPMALTDVKPWLEAMFQEFTAEKLPDSHIKLTLIHAASGENPAPEMTIVADEQRNFLIESIAFNALPNHNTVMSVKPKWEEHEGIWLPVAVDIDDSVNGTRSQIEYRWAGVNKPIPKETFELQNLPLQDKQLIGDYRIGATPILVAQKGVPDFVTPTYFKPGGKPLIGTRALLIGANLAILVILLFLSIKWRAWPKA
jgi:hypothetical protein